MLSISRTGGILGAFLLGLVYLGTARADEKAPADDKKVQLGMPNSLFQGVPDYLKQAGAAPFLKMMKAQTGIDGNINFVADSMSLASQLNDGKIHLGVFQGHEFAWAKEKYSDLIPIAVTVPINPNQSFCVVSWDCKAKNIGELKTGKISLPPIHRDYCELFLASQKEEHMKGATFAGQLKAGQAVEAIDDVIAGKACCAVVDCATLKFFENVFPGQFQNIKVLCKSEVFPNACIAVRKGQIDDKTIASFKKALTNAPNDPTGRFLLTNWKLKGFNNVPDDYDLQLKKFLKAYPTPPTLRVSVDR